MVVHYFLEWGVVNFGIHEIHLNTGYQNNSLQWQSISINSNMSIWSSFQILLCILLISIIFSLYFTYVHIYIILYVPYHPISHFVKIDTVFSAISCHAPIPVRQSHFPTSVHDFPMGSPWFHLHGLEQSGQMLLQLRLRRPLLDGLMMDAIPSHHSPRSPIVTVLTPPEPSFEFVSLVPRALLWHHHSHSANLEAPYFCTGFGSEFVRKGNSLRFEVDCGEIGYCLFCKTCFEFETSGKTKTSVFSWASQPVLQTLSLFRCCLVYSMATFFESSGLWPATLALCTYILTVLHPALPSEHPHSLGLTVSSTHWTLLRIGSNVMDLAHPLVQQQSVRGILGACGWFFVAQWHFLSSHEAWFSMTRIASQEHWGHKHAINKRHAAHIITFSNHATCHRTSLNIITNITLIPFFYVSYKLYRSLHDFW